MQKSWLQAIYIHVSIANDRTDRDYVLSNWTDRDYVESNWTDRDYVESNWNDRQRLYWK